MKLLMAVCVATILAAADAPAAPGGQTYCGVRCVYAAAQSLGGDVSMEDLLKPQYVGSTHGSTIDELRQAVVDHGLAAEVVTGLSIDGLRGLVSPTILHVRGDGYRASYAHWVLFLGVDGGSAKILDPPEGVQLVPLAELAARWDGAGLIVARSDSNIALSRAATGLISLGLAACVAAAGAWAARSAARRISRPAYQAAALAGVAVVLAACWHVLTPAGFLRNPAAVADVRANHVQPPLTRLDLAGFNSLRAEAGTVVVDARPHNAYAAGHIPGAVSLPINASRFDRSEVLARIAGDPKVILYCQNTSCPWAEIVAGDLAARGFGALYVYPGGWKEWRTHADKHR